MTNKIFTILLLSYTMNISDLTDSFEFVDSMTVERNDAGLVDLKMPQRRYEKSDEYSVHQYGWGPFCRISVDTSEYTGSEGVYIFTSGYEIKYVGETVDLHNRLQSGYANISPKNCFEGGQQTNCRINNLILNAVRGRCQVSLWFEERHDRKRRETELIEQCDPPWNKASTESRDVTTHRSTSQKSTSRRNRSTNIDTAELGDRFDCVGSVSVERDGDGRVDEKYPQKRYSKSDQKDLHPDGRGPYCEFEIDTSDYEGSEGVFVFSAGNEVKYVGRTSDIDSYICQIESVKPSSCYENGQQTVCRLNTRVFHAARDGKEVSLWVTESSSPDRLKEELKDKFSPSWNL